MSQDEFGVVQTCHSMSALSCGGEWHGRALLYLSVQHCATSGTESLLVLVHSSVC